MSGAEYKPEQNPAALELEELEDSELMLAYQNGYAAAFEMLYSRHKAPMLRWLSRHCGTGEHNRELANELFQDVWMKIIHARDSWRPEAKFTTWAYRIAHNRMIDEFRRNARNPVEMDNEAVAIDQSSPESDNDNHQLQLRLQQAVASLPVEQRSAFLLKEERGLSLEEIAEVMGVGRETVKSRLRYAVGKLRSDLAQYRTLYHSNATQEGRHG